MSRVQTAVVTGASRGFGRATAALLVAAGTKVVGIARDERRLRAVRDELGTAFVPVAADATDDALAHTVLREHRPGLLVLNAGAVPHYGATGGIGSAAVQLLKNLGVTVTAVCATQHLALVQRLGADRVVDYTAEDFTQDEQTYDAVYDAVGKSTFGRCRRLLKPGGVYLSAELGPWAQNPLLALVTPLLRGRTVKIAFPRDNQAIVRHLRDLIESGDFIPVIDRRYTLDQIVDAYRYVESGQKVGNVVLTVASGPTAAGGYS